MLAPAVKRGVDRRQRARPEAVPSPLGGWNTRDSLDAMAPEDAVILDNWFPGLGACAIRGGSGGYASGLGGPVRTLAEFNAGSSRKFIAAANSRIWDISSAGAGVSLASGFGSDIWHWAQFDDASGGARMGLVNGADAPQIYNGTAVSAMTISGVGLTTTLLNGIHIYKSRSYFWDDRTQDFWYSATNALGGALTKFPLGRVQGTGGNLTAIGTWSRDSGDGMQDVIVFVLSSGDALVYAGDNPGDAAAWALVGRYTIGAPISKRAIKKIGSDLYIVTKAGYLPLSTILQSGRFNEQAVAASSKIRGAALAAVSANSALFGWDLQHYPLKNQLIINSPLTTTQAVQHVMNTETGAWCRFTGLQGLCWGSFRDLMYFGLADGTVHLYDTGHGDLGSSISADGQSAWNYLGDRRASKRATAIRPLLRTSGGVLTYGIAVGFDFADITIGVMATAPAVSTSAWDVSAWDVTPWADDFSISNRWSSIRGDGYAISSRLKISSSTQGVDWYSTTYLTERGGVL